MCKNRRTVGEGSTSACSVTGAGGTVYEKTIQDEKSVDDGSFTGSGGIVYPSADSEYD